MFRYYYDANKIGAQIRKIRKENHMTQEELAAELVLSVDSISNYENGKTTCMPEHMMHICEIFNVSMDYFYFEDSISKELEVPDMLTGIMELLKEAELEDVERVEQMIRLLLKK